MHDRLEASGGDRRDLAESLGGETLELDRRVGTELEFGSVGKQDGGPRVWAGSDDISSLQWELGRGGETLAAAQHFNRPLDADEAACPFLGGYRHRPQEGLEEESEKESPHERLPPLEYNKAPPPEASKRHAP
jgi:hypothetical protein